LRRCKKKGEDATEARGEIDLGLTAPHEPIVEDGAAAQVRADEITIDALVERGARVVGKLVETGEPGGRAAATVLESCFRKVVQAIVVAIDAELRSQDGRILQGFVEKGPRQLSALGHQA
jgi:hypothetical protein